HKAFSLAMGKPVYTPIDISDSGLKILDSGCNTGCWLLDLAEASAPATHEYIGTDVWSSVFPPNPPENFHFFEQDICKPWPPSWHGTFDLVHQRTVLANIRKTPLRGIISQMTELLRPGGWIQLMEADFAPISGNGPALQEFLEIVSWFFETAGPGRDMGPMLKSELEGLGLEDVRDRVV
ncbi:hypothetical protein BO71DRAFT_278699, partial [Aspergillus ellipticus CBS 707.79]